MIEEGFDILHDGLGNPTFTISGTTVDCIAGGVPSAETLGLGGFEPQGDLVLHIKASDASGVTLAVGGRVTYSSRSYRILSITESPGIVSLDLADVNKR